MSDGTQAVRSGGELMQTLPEPYYHDEASGITIYCADCRDVLPYLEPVDLVLTDPPYSEQTHSGARTLNEKNVRRLVTFEHVDGIEWMSSVAPLVGKWLVSTMDWKHIAIAEAAPPAMLRFVRFGIWIKPNSAPQFTGDRPAQGWEGVAIMHKAGEKMEWNGGGSRAVWTQNAVVTDHPTGKPIALIRKWVSLFSNPGDVILDPFMGSGTTLRAAKDLGRRAIGIEISEEYCEIAVRRLSQQVLPLGV